MEPLEYRYSFRIPLLHIADDHVSPYQPVKSKHGTPERIPCMHPAFQRGRPNGSAGSKDCSRRWRPAVRVHGAFGPLISIVCEITGELGIGDWGLGAGNQGLESCEIHLAVGVKRGHRFVRLSYRRSRGCGHAEDFPTQSHAGTLGGVPSYPPVLGTVDGTGGFGATRGAQPALVNPPTGAAAG